jgi:hypothetical protein
MFIRIKLSRKEIKLKSYGDVFKFVWFVVEYSIPQEILVFLNDFHELLSDFW